MLLDILVVLVIVLVAAALGLTLHPLFWLVLLLIVVWLVFRPGARL